MPEREPDPTTEELRLDQLQREADERKRAAQSPTEDESEQHERRAEKAHYLREKLDERAASEREAAREDAHDEDEHAHDEE
ncbi:MAG: hypothetical protein E6G29_03215 [Actinobacteria bacterium]|nr:MAG: hypothetical protein E6G29_03215 [Actinomycetota bacterium]